MFRLDFLGLLWAANLVYGRPAADETYQLATSSTPCSFIDVVLSLRTATRYVGTCDDTEDDRYVFLHSNTCATISNFKCRVERMPCTEFSPFMCIDASKSNTCQPTFDSPPGIYVSPGLCPGDLRCCQGQVLYSLSTYPELSASLPVDALKQITPGAENNFFGLQADSVALLGNDGPLYQPFTEQPGTDDSLGSASFNTVEGVDLDAFRISTDPPVFKDDFPQGYSIMGGDSQDEDNGSPPLIRI